ncbi:hypothetical protein B0T26DRAFT_101656 [Lasiosphaeria miniovina]|uniref:C6 transcription factor n=1 Tax=Lasiosphaeria miniovina TaxID=1954250 RepID=A0AA40B341_9PEZI|nr:uncharacterized protein B0T26DRAFT_101656 [Lasiosphaeria miniovina]KAK0726735.1 hypothetical protein B0T26DRAFT_101656 [Lasiosphaeria miniovina]
MVSTRSSSTAIATPRAQKSESATPPPSTIPKTRASRASNASAWSHAPSTLTLVWLGVTLPLVIYDTTYVLLRPLTMEGGSLHWPLFVPYEMYGDVDHVYGWPAFERHDGFTGAQSFMNVVETAMYLVYLGLWYRNAKPAKTAGARPAVDGPVGALALLIGFSAAVMTFSKTALYWLNEYYSGYSNVGHNSIQRVIFVFVLLNGPWLIGPAIITYRLGSEIVAGLASASAPPARRGKSE